MSQGGWEGGKGRGWGWGGWKGKKGKGRLEREKWGVEKGEMDKMI